MVMSSTIKYHPQIEIISKDGLYRLKAVPEYSDKPWVPVKDKYFDQFATYAPGNWIGSRRLRDDEIEEAKKWLRKKNLLQFEENEGLV